MGTEITPSANLELRPMEITTPADHPAYDKPDRDTQNDIHTDRRTYRQLLNEATVTSLFEKRWPIPPPGWRGTTLVLVMIGYSLQLHHFFEKKVDSTKQRRKFFSNPPT